MKRRELLDSDQAAVKPDLKDEARFAYMARRHGRQDHGTRGTQWPFYPWSHRPLFLRDVDFDFETGTDSQEPTRMFDEDLTPFDELFFHQDEQAALAESNEIAAPDWADEIRLLLESGEIDESSAYKMYLTFNEPISDTDDSMLVHYRLSRMQTPKTTLDARPIADNVGEFMDGFTIQRF